MQDEQRVKSLRCLCVLGLERLKKQKRKDTVLSYYSPIHTVSVWWEVQSPASVQPSLDWFLDRGNNLCHWSVESLSFHSIIHNDRLQLCFNYYSPILTNKDLKIHTVDKWAGVKSNLTMPGRLLFSPPSSSSLVLLIILKPPPVSVSFFQSGGLFLCLPQLAWQRTDCSVVTVCIWLLDWHIYVLFI